MSVYIAGSAFLAPSPGAIRIETIGDENDPKTKRLPRIDRLALSVARTVMKDVSSDDVALIVGTNNGGLQATIDFLEGMAARGPAFASPMAFHESVHHAPAGQLAILLKLTGLSLTCSNRELSGEGALKAGVDLIESGRTDRVLVVSCEEAPAAALAAYRAFHSEVLPTEGAAAVLLTKAKTPIELTNIQITAHQTSTLRFWAPPKNTEQGLIRLARGIQELKEPSDTLRITSFAQGGGCSTLEVLCHAA